MAIAGSDRRFLAALAMVLAAAASSARSAAATECPQESLAAGPLYGLTLNSVWEEESSSGVTTDLQDILASLEEIGKAQCPITRIVFDEFVEAERYRPAVEAIREVSYVMGEILDSSSVYLYSVVQYAQRTSEYVDAFKDRVDLWEIGNEVNGEWLGPIEEVVARMTTAYEVVRVEDKPTALTLYYNEGCWARPENEMFRWARAWVPRHIKEGLDYVFVSYYEDHCAEGPAPDWDEVFSRLGKMFPNALLGFGEVGTEKKGEKSNYITKYYSQPPLTKHPRFVGGYFWWWGRQDFVPCGPGPCATLIETIRPNPGPP